VRLDSFNGRNKLVLKPLWPGLAMGEKILAGCGWDGEAWRYRQTQVGHLGQACALSAQNALHISAAIGRASPEKIDGLLRHVPSLSIPGGSNLWIRKTRSGFSFCSNQSIWYGNNVVLSVNSCIYEL
jgi:hypothetical protein